MGEPMGVAVSSRTLAVQHVTITTTRSYDEVKARLESRLGRLDDTARDLLKSGQLDALRERLEGIAGDAGLAIHYVGPHGDWLALQGERRKICNYLIGNVLYAVQMTGIHPGAGLYAPLRIVISNWLARVKFHETGSDIPGALSACVSDTTSPLQLRSEDVSPTGTHPAFVVESGAMGRGGPTPQWTNASSPFI